jgi:hypothetical protein
LAAPATSETPALAVADERRVVLELFTSQGCSSCPAAEQVLSQIGVQEELRAKVVPLAFHVDYWDEGGWHDPFSAREWTERQIAYGRSFGGDGPYTPQLIVDGRVQFNGSDARRLLTEIAASLESAPAASIGLAPSSNPARSSEIAITVSAGSTPSWLSSRAASPREWRVGRTVVVRCETTSSCAG